MDEPTDLTPPAAAGKPALEAGSLARETARAYAELLKYYRQRLNQTPEEAEAEVAGLMERYADLVTGVPPEAVSWSALGSVWERDPERGEAAWGRVLNEARDELDSGHRAAIALDWHKRPWERAQFLALRQALRDEWQPRGGIEDALIDNMAEAYTMSLLFLSRLHAQALGEGGVDDHKYPPHGSWQPPPLDVAAAMDQSAAMADRFHRMFLRGLRALRDLRRYAPAVVVQNAGQVNVGGQQLNVAPGCDASGSGGLGASTGDELGSGG